MHKTTERVYTFVRGYTIEHGYAPTTREIAQGVGLASNSTVAWHLKQLEVLRYIRRGKSGRIAVLSFVDEIEQLQYANRLLYQAALMHKSRADRLEVECEMYQRMSLCQ